MPFKPSSWEQLASAQLTKSSASPLRTLILVSSTMLLGGLLVSGLMLASRWPFIADAPILHYILFLMSKGFAPYRDIVDMNMPGCYLFQSLAVRLFGTQAAGWFHWDLCVDMVVLLASTWIGGPSRRLAGSMAGMLACLMHLADGAWDLGQRDWIVAALLLVCFACLFHALRGAHAAWIFGALFFGSLAATIKPPAILFPLLAVAIVCWWNRSSTPRVLSILGWAAAGLVLPLAMVLLFLAKWHIFASFFATARGLLPYYAAQQRMNLWQLLWQTLANRERFFGLLALAALCSSVAMRARYTLEEWLLAAACCCGLISYLVQAKGFTYHRYSFEVFLSLFILFAIDQGLRSKGFRPTIATALMLCVWTVAAADLRREREVRSETYDTVVHLQADLVRMGGAALSQHIQCLDMTWAGCINALNRMQLVQSTGSLYDFYLFPEKATPLTAALQQRFLEQVTADPPYVFVLSQQVWPGDRLGYEKVGRWPAFQSFLADRYALAEDQPRLPGEFGGYRIYSLKTYEERRSAPEGKGKGEG